MSPSASTFPNLPCPCISITDAFEGLLTPQQLLQAERSVQMMLPNPSLVPSAESGRIFVLQDDGFAFWLVAGGNCFFFGRNETQVELDSSPIRHQSNPYVLIAGWNRAKLILSLMPYGHEAPLLFAEAETTPTMPPPSLVRWSRRETLSERFHYESETDFFTRVFSILGGVQEKIDSMTNANAFWDIEYEGNRIVARRPKREKDLQPVVHSVLADHAFLSSIDVVPEYRLGSGALDFMFLGAIRSQGIAKVCVEFKSLHSPDLLKGLRHQLPEYMRRANALVGAYCTLDFRGPWFSEPVISQSALSAKLTVAIRASGQGKRLFPIQYFQYGVGQRPHPSHPNAA